MTSGQRKLELAELCAVAQEINLEYDPDGLIEDRSEVISKKLVDGAVSLANPALLIGTRDLSALPFFSFMDVFSHLTTSSLSFGSIREYQKSEGYTLMSDGYVRQLDVVTYDEQPGYFALKAHVKPRTRDKDPVTGAAFYYPWITISSRGTDVRSCVLSAFCTCKGVDFFKFY